MNLFDKSHIFSVSQCSEAGACEYGSYIYFGEMKWMRNERTSAMIRSQNVQKPISSMVDNNTDLFLCHQSGTADCRLHVVRAHNFQTSWGVGGWKGTLSSSFRYSHRIIFNVEGC